ncbi:MAG: hypothetical protein JW720_07150 [Sedimentisphaerales bacterium]|nr:hypothetical protein [Sedimentisphaerales bacterium]
MIGSNVPLGRQGSGRCIVCGRITPLMRKREDRDRVIAGLKRRRPERPAPCGHGQPGVCKDCCIAALEGHGCIWWELCWQI